LLEDTRINGNEFSWIASIFFLGYLAFQIPNQYLIQKFSISNYLGTFIILWGINLGCTALASNFQQLIILRFFQGFFEAAAYPCIQILFCSLYRTKEQIIWFSIMLMTNEAAFAVGGLIGIGFLNLDGAYGLRGWKWCMLILGCVSTGCGIITYLFLPDTPKSRWYRLTPAQIAIVDERLRDNKVVPNKVVNVNHIREALKEPQLYCYFLISLLLNLEHGCISIFSTTIIKTMGFSNTESILLNIPLAFSGIVILLCTIYLNRRFDENSLVGALGCFVSFISILLLAVLPKGGPQLAGLYLSSVGSGYVIGLTMISNNVCGYTKKIFYNGAYIFAYCLGSFLGPLMMRENESPHYLSALIGYMIGLLISSILFLYLRWSYTRDNQARLKLKLENMDSTVPIEEINSANNMQQEDLTDKQNMTFLYRP
ncbi:major facilitator superfamily domain-containing protein, partial [Circinella umbellata]